MKEPYLLLPILFDIKMTVHVLHISSFSKNYELEQTKGNEREERADGWVDECGK